MVKFLKFPFALVILFALCFSLVTGQSEVIAAAASKPAVTLEKINVRSGPGTNYKIIGSMAKGQKVTVYSQTKSGWSEILYNKKKAYLSTKYLKFTPVGVQVKKHYYNNIKELSYPQVKGLANKEAEKKINASLLTEAVLSYKAYVQTMENEKDMQDDELCTDLGFACDFDYEAHYTINYNDGKTLSLLIYNYMYEGGAHGMGGVTGKNFRVATGQEIKLTHILNTSAKISKVQQYAFNYMKKHPETFYVTKASHVPINKNTTFYYGHDGIYLKFQSYEVGPYSSGYPVVKIPSSVYR
ncbi:PdaC/SigV domain-containing protein [Fictibacillus iocasae]|uniref:PdaC/SigV domain-containing protein n=1 Tax=Fictibacillus iocasae TaxID=2715437 RepID=A0ABW2NNQ8_9BACL